MAAVFSIEGQVIGHCQGVEGLMLGEVRTVRAPCPSSNLVLSSISYNMASEKVLNWLYSVLVNVIVLATTHSYALTACRNTPT